MAGVLSAFGKAPKNYGDVEFWHTPERAGWLMKQGTHGGMYCSTGSALSPHGHATLPRRTSDAGQCTCLSQSSHSCQVMVAAGEYIKTWRRRWFILKQGRIFWFKTEYVTPVSECPCLW